MFDRFLRPPVWKWSGTILTKKGRDEQNENTDKANKKGKKEKKGKVKRE